MQKQFRRQQDVLPPSLGPAAGSRQFPLPQALENTCANPVQKEKALIQ
jgi:hypothetical protein